MNSSQYQLFLLGPPRLDANKQIVRLDTRKSLALLSYLSLHDYEFQRDNLAVLLWPNLDQTRARAALRRTLTPLNKALGKGALITTRETVKLNPEFPLWADDRDFLENIAAASTHGHGQNEVCRQCLEPLEHALSLYRGRFMSGFSLRDSAAFDDWQFSIAESRHRDCSDILEKLTIYYENQGEFDKALQNGLLWSGMDPLLEPAHRALMRIYLETGQRPLALRQYRECLRVLDEELGVSPLEETTQLYQDILENRLMQNSATSVRVKPLAEQREKSISSDPTQPIVGRNDSWQKLDAIFQKSKTNGQFVAIEGEIGIGKTRLAEDFSGYAQKQGALLLAARCYEGEINMPYGPIAAAIRNVLTKDIRHSLTQSIDAVWLAEAGRLLPELHLQSNPVDPLETDPISAQSRLFEAIRQILLHIIPENAPIIFLIDDLHWADNASLDLLAYLVRRIDQIRLMIIGTWRSENKHQNTRSQSFYTEAVQTGAATLIQLERLNEADIHEIITHFPEVPNTIRQSLYRLTEGLPFFAIEYLTAGLHLEDGAIPTGIRDIQLARLSKLDQTSNQLLTTAAVIGRSFDFETLRFASGRSEEETVNALEDLLQAHLLIEKITDETLNAREPSLTPPRYDFSHETLHQVVLEQTSLARQRLLNRRIAESYLNQAQKINENASRIGLHLSKSGQDAQAAEYYFIAGDHARMLYANEEAMTHYKTASALGHPDSAAIHEAIGDLLTLRGEYQKAILSYEKSASRAVTGNLPQIERKLANVHHRKGDYELAAYHFQNAIDYFKSPSEAPELCAQINIDWSRTASQVGDYNLGRELAVAGLALAESINNMLLTSLAHNVLGIITRRVGDQNEAREHLENALSTAGDSLPAQIAALNNLALLSSDEAKFTEAIDLTSRALDLCTIIGDRHREAALRNHLADRLHANDQKEEAMVELKKAVEIFAEIGEEMGGLQPEIWKLIDW